MRASKTRELFRRVRRRLYLIDFGVHWHGACLILGGALLLLILSVRVLALLPDVLAPPVVLLVPLLAALHAAVFARPPDDASAAHAIDGRAGTDDLFLTLTGAAATSENFVPAVTARAAAAAARIDPGRIVRLNWPPGVRNVLSLVAILLLAVLYLPQFDPFGRDEMRQQAAKQQQALTSTRQATAERTDLLRRRERSPQAKAVERAVERLKSAFRTMPTGKQAENFRRLSENQRRLGKLWRDMSKKRLKTTVSPDAADQQFGDDASRKTANWRRQLRRGKLDGARNELRALQQMAQELAEAKTAAQHRQLAEELRRRLRTLADFARRELCSQPAETALQRALSQLDMASLAQLDGEALRALGESLELGRMELSAAEATLQSLRQVENALAATQLAKQLNQLQTLRGAGDGQCETVADYADLYRRLLSQCRGGAGNNTGEGMRGPGVGRGGKAPEDETAVTDFTPQQAKSALQAGKILLSWKTHEVGPSGNVKHDYAQAVEAIRQGVSEAVIKEEVPPGYHDAIKGYFDAMKKDSATDR